MRCDEAKPSCARCVTTGRVCDGYGAMQQPVDIPFRATTNTTATQISNKNHLGSSRSGTSQDDSLPITLADATTSPPGASPDATADLKLVIPRKSTAEMRSYRYFLDVTCPAIAGSFDVDLWMREIPQACFADPAVWHAAVSFGSVYEYYTTLAFTGHRPYQRNEFALKQFNSSIRYLTASPSTPASKWRALTISIIFVCICCLESLFDEARMHYQYGYKLLHEIEADLDTGSEDAKSNSTDTDSRSPSPESAVSQRKPPYQSPISIASLRRILCCFELREVTLFNGGTIELPTIDAEQDLYRAWAGYVRPSSHAERHLTIDNMTYANRAAQSLMNSCLVFSQDNTNELVEAFTEPSQEIIESLARKREPLLQCFQDIDTAVGIFQDILGPESEDKSHGTRKLIERKQLRLALLSLRLSHELNRFLLAQYPDWVNLNDKNDGSGINLSKASCTKVLDLADETEALQNELRAWGGGVAVPPIAMITMPVAFVVLMGQKWADRRRALNALKRPRLEGLLEHAMASNLATAIVDREMRLAKEFAQSNLEDDEILDGQFHPMCRVHKTKIDFITGARKADIEMKTWYEVANDLPGEKLSLEW